MGQRVYVTGIGIVSAIGNDVSEVMDSLKSSRTGIGRLELIDSVYRDELPVAEIKVPTRELFDLALPAKRSCFSRTSLLGIIAAKQAVIHAELEMRQPWRTGLISATTVGGMDRTELFFREFRNDHAKGRIGNVAGHDCGDSTEKIADCLGVKDFLSTVNTACSSSANSIMLGARLIRHGKLDRVVAGGTDALTLFTLNGFNSLMILDRQQCKPFDQDRNGLNLGEGSAFLVLESEEAADRKSKKPLCELTGYGNTCDAYHQTASSPDGQGAYLSMQKSLRSAQLSPGEIGYINTHGTGTRNNDLSEGIAIERLFGTRIPPCSSTKSFTGHTLGAAGAIEAVLSVIALMNGWLYPNLNFTNQMHELSFTPLTELMTGIAVRNIMSNSFGFGGNNSSLIFTRV